MSRPVRFGQNCESLLKDNKEAVDFRLQNERIAKISSSRARKGAQIKRQKTFGGTERY